MEFIRSLFKKYPREDVEVMSDLDALITKPVGFKLNGKTYIIRAIDTERFLRLTEDFSKLDKLRVKNKITPDELAKAYADLITDACPEMKFKDVMALTQAQVGALLQLIIDTVTGKEQAKNLKKKIATNEKKIQKSMPS